MGESTAKWDHCLEIAAASDIGLRRANNQDSMTVALANSQETFQKRGHFFMVADGMGAHAAGELASKMATDIVALSYHKLLDHTPPRAVLEAFRDANEQIHSRGQASIDFRGMGTTGTLLVLLPEGALVGNVGDSRTYRLRGERFEQLTFDHSLVWEMRAAGQFPDGKIPSSAPSNIITRSLGPAAAVQPDVEGPFPMQVGDTFLLCSDGLSGQVEDDEMGTILGCLSPIEAVRAMVDLSNLRGGPDNITLIVARVTGPQEAVGGPPLPKRDNEQPNTKPIHAMVWTMLGACALACLGLATMGHFLAAGIAAMGALGAGTIALAQRFGGEESTGFANRPLGKGPYAVCNCVAGNQFASQAAGIVKEVRQAAETGNCKLDWQQVAAFEQHAADAEAKAEYPQAIRERFRAISFIMDELKQDRRNPPT